MGTKAYKHETEIFDPVTGEILHDTKYSVTAVNNEEDYIKVYRYLNTVFAFKNINQAYIPCLMEIANYMSFADKGQEVILNERYRQLIAEALNVSVKRVNDIITGLKKADVLRPITNPETGKPFRSTFAVNPFIIGRGKWSDIKELRAQFDYNSGLMVTQSVVQDRITGETMAKITQERKKDSKQIPGQMSLFDQEGTDAE
jgi:hypothetical protein